MLRNNSVPLFGERGNAPDASDSDEANNGNRNNQPDFAQYHWRDVEMMSDGEFVTYVSGVIDCKCVHETDIATGCLIPVVETPSDGQVPGWLTSRLNSAHVS